MSKIFEEFIAMNGQAIKSILAAVNEFVAANEKTVEASNFAVKIMRDATGMPDASVPEVVYAASGKKDDPLMGAIIQSALQTYCATRDRPKTAEMEILQELAAALVKIDKIITAKQPEITAVASAPAPTPTPTPAKKVDVASGIDLPKFRFKKPESFVDVDASVLGIQNKYAFRRIEDGARTEYTLFDMNTGKKILPMFKNGEDQFYVDRKYVRAADLAILAYGINSEALYDPDEEESTTAPTPTPTPTPTQVEPDGGVFVTWIPTIPCNKYKIYPDGRCLNTVTGKFITPQTGYKGRRKYMLSSTTCSTGDRTAAVNKWTSRYIDDLVEKAGFPPIEK